VGQRFISVKEVVKRACLSKTELYRRLNAGRFPKPFALGPKKVVFLESEVDAWMRAQVLVCDSSANFRRLRARNAVGSRRDRKIPVSPATNASNSLRALSGKRRNARTGEV
jgi:prophage regulatory protein